VKVDFHLVISPQVEVFWVVTPCSVAAAIFSITSFTQKHYTASQARRNCYFTLMIKAVRSSETFVSYRNSTRRNDAEEIGT